ncbi:3145_t:CDS:2 [Cetraspora pellucida]|uniref:3145_t:CDS:1 n=1 Tax=Cetraspora pellucida TaxID=1433469 RepID=A0A9N9I940_9GLOM|nr:3145_t:CDS:2 [Cetraspora pellucida]
MIFENLFQKYRKTDATSLFVLKSFVSILLLISVLGYTWIIIWGIYNDNPVVQNSLKEENYMPIPAVDIEIFQTIYKTNISTKISCNFVNASGIHDCNRYIKSTNKRKTDLIASRTFLARDLMFSAVPNNGISSLEFKIYLNDTSYNISNRLAPFTIPYIITNQSYKLKIKRKRKELMLPSWENYIGFSSKLESIPYFTSKLESSPLLNNIENPTILPAKLIIEPQSFITQVETDKRFILSTNAIKPWGLTQKYGFKINKSVQTKLKNTLEFIPLVNHPKTSNNLNTHELKRRLDSLQIFLTEYVVDVHYLEKIYKANINEKGRPREKIWDYYIASNVVGDCSATCHYCSKYWSCGCPGEMEAHLANICPDELTNSVNETVISDIDEFLLYSNQELLSPNTQELSPTNIQKLSSLNIQEFLLSNLQGLSLSNDQEIASPEVIEQTDTLTISEVINITNLSIETDGQLKVNRSHGAAIRLVMWHKTLLYKEFIAIVVEY